MRARLATRMLGVLVTVGIVAALGAQPVQAADARGVMAARTVFYQAVIDGEHLPWQSDGDIAGRLGQGRPMEAMWIMPWGGGEICASVFVPSFGWQNWRCAQPGDSFRIGTVGHGLSMSGLHVKTQFGRLCFRVYASTPGVEGSAGWRDTHCADAPFGVGDPAGNYQIEAVVMYYES